METTLKSLQSKAAPPAGGRNPEGHSKPPTAASGGREMHVPFLRQLRGEVTCYWLGASAGAILADLILWRMAARMHATWLEASLIGVILLIVVLALLVQWRFRVLFRPIRILYHEVMQLQRGDLGDHGVQVAGRTDLVLVVRALQDAKRSIRDILVQLKQVSNDLADSSSSLRTGASETSLASKQNASVVMDMAGAVETQHQLTQKTQAAMAQTLATVRQIQEMSLDTSKLSQVMLSKAQSGKDEMAGTTRRMGDIEREVQELSQRAKELAHWASQVMSTSQAIRSIAEQTNLLALNAAIEAARAGDAGRGFAVVAGQVRKLAEQASDDSERIHGVVVEMEQHAKASVSSIESVAANVSEGARAVTATEQSFLSIVEDIHDLEQRVQNVHAAAEGISEQAGTVDEFMQSLVAISSSQSEAIETVAASSEEQLSMMEEVSRSASTMSQMAGDLQVAAARFQW
ncbi:hypothetical protein AAC03nite_17260 [Alicyclobacillus acidoterrestris]|uniref:methyl-accepting chemotaxis protein n=1 Tax=Alicyclobacillus suci TaxID=2816080 RepID=UPI001191A1F3|nr:methyl-accepting chemotaxis protein [Alicyclobacillus suci]GEO25941.1 hypothetical protein AAC03nite_17260 [Alicyclobacillus acidoterrestris]